MKWMSADAQHRDLAAEWKALRGKQYRWGWGWGFLRQRPDAATLERLRPPLASATEMKRAKWKMNYERDENGRLV